MTITNIFDAALCGDMDKLKQYYEGNINYIDKCTKLNLLQTVMCGNDKYLERLDIVSFLIQEGIEVNYQGGKNKKMLYICYTHLQN